MMNVHKKSGFTLVETVLAIGLIGVLIVLFVAMFYPSRKTIQAALTIQEADRLVNALTDELSIVRKPELAPANAKISSQTRYVSAFDKAYYWMQQTERPGTTILIYSYRGDLEKPKREDGSLPLFEGQEYLPGKNSVLVTTACLATNKSRLEDLRSAVGTIFAVRMSQIVIDENKSEFKYVVSDVPGQIGNPYMRQTRIKKPEEYMYDPKNRDQPSWGAGVMYKAEFFQVQLQDPEMLKNMNWEQLKTPAFSRNLIFRR